MDRPCTGFAILARFVEARRSDTQALLARVSNCHNLSSRPAAAPGRNPFFYPLSPIPYPLSPIPYPLSPIPFILTMATESNMLPLGTKAPSFRLPDFKGKTISIDDFASSPALLVAFICNHCPYVKHIRSEFARFARDYHSRGVAVVAIASNDIETYPQDGPAGMAEEAQSAGYTFPYLFDETQKVARAYGAACTPDFFLFDRGRELVYRGQFDASRPGNSIPVTGQDMRAACDLLLADKPVPTEQRPSIGCSIKWKK
jgi:peroxiredoxin